MAFCPLIISNHSHGILRLAGAAAPRCSRLLLISISKGLLTDRQPTTKGHLINLEYTRSKAAGGPTVRSDRCGILPRTCILRLKETEVLNIIIRISSAASLSHFYQLVVFKALAAPFSSVTLCNSILQCKNLKSPTDTMQL